MSRNNMLVGIVLSLAASSHAVEFKAAKPVWPEGREREMNLNVSFEARFDWDGAGSAPVLRLAACTTYRAYLNGETYVGYGPARGPHGSYRIDEWDLGSRGVRAGKNVLAIEVAGYAINSFGTLHAPSFLQAEVIADGKVLAATGIDRGFETHLISRRIQKTQRYSFQRPFSEAYRLKGGKDSSRGSEGVAKDSLTCAVQPEVKLLPHGVPYPTFRLRPAVRDVSEGKLEPNQPVKDLFKDRSLTRIDKILMGYPEDQLEVIPSIELQKIKTIPTRQLDGPPQPAHLASNSYRITDLGTNLTGFVGCRLTCLKPGRFFIVFDEILSNGDVDEKRLACVNVVQINVEDAGTYAFESCEPYTMRYVKLMALEGEFQVEGVYLRELTAPDVWEATFASSDPRLGRLFEAGRETYRQNALDIFMDCPSRERAGWLCDSFFTSRVARDLSGHTKIERNFYENYLVSVKYPTIPDGMLPMCYPSDHYDGVFIPNWAMWFVVELEEYAARSGDAAMVEALKPKVMGLIQFLDQFNNSDGLLEKLPSWVFVEWSAANNFVQDVNYPSNALYARVLECAGRLYGDKRLTDRAAAMRETIRKQSFDGTWFVDNAVRKDGKLEVTKNHTETCQYYMFYFDIAAPQTHADLWKKLTTEFGPKREGKGLYKEVPPSNSFIGNMLRMEILSRQGLGQQVLDESIDYLMYMADRTGTLWENVKPEASCNHGFASHIVHTLYRDILGARELHTQGKRSIVLRFNDVKLEWCEGRLPTPDGFVSVHWRRDGGTIRYRLDTPAGYAVSVSAGDGLQAVREH